MAMVAGAMLIAVAACGDSKSGVSVREADQTETTPATDTTPIDTGAVDTSAADTVATTADSEPPTSTVSTTDASDTTEPATSEPETTAPATTEPPTTEPATTEPTTSAPVFPPGWQPVDFFNDGVIAPKAEENWSGVPSPPLPPTGQPLADGIYPADAVAWDPANPASLGIIVQRLDQCTALPENACVSFGDPYLPTELGVNESTTLPLTVALDDTVGVGLVGYECTPIAKRGNGADLAALFTAFNSAYTSTIAPQLTPDGHNDQAIIDAITAAPTAGFSAAAATCPDLGEQGLVFKAGEAPPILMQLITGFIDTDSGYERPPLTPITATYLESVEVVNGHMTMYFYAGFYS